MNGAWHLVAGSTGAGKTTYARALAQRVGGVVFSIDEWMNTLFWPDCPEKNDFPWALERVARCEAQAAAVAAQLAHAGVPAIVDMGLTTRVQRTKWVQWAVAAEVPVILDLLDLPAELRWTRVERRNASEAGTFAFVVSRAMFNAVESLWELPEQRELALYRQVVRVTE